MALKFGTTTSDRVSFGTGVPTSGVAQGTLCIWFWADDIANTLKYLMNKTGTTPNNGWEFFRRAALGHSLRFAWYDTAGGGKNDIFADNFIRARTWIFAAVAWDNTTGTNSKMYRGFLNANAARYLPVTIATTAGTVATDTANTLNVGCSALAASSWVGRIAQISMWSRTLSPKEIIQQQWFGLRWDYVPNSSAKCIFYTRLGKTLGTQPDLTGLGHHGTITGCTVAPDIPQLRNRRDYSKLVRSPPAAAVKVPSPMIVNTAVHRSSYW